MGNAFIIDAVRTPRGRGKMDKGALSSVHPQELFAQTINQLADRTKIEKNDIDDVVVGTVSQAGEQGGCIARMAVLAAGFPHGITGVSLNRFCGSGQQSVMFAAMGCASGAQDLVIGGGVESMSRNPMGSDKAGLDGHNRHLREMFPFVPQGISADLVASREGFTRDIVDGFALRSQQNAARAMKEDSDLGDLLVTIEVGALPSEVVEAALDAGHSRACQLCVQGLIEAAFLSLNGKWRTVNALTAAESFAQC